MSASLVFIPPLLRNSDKEHQNSILATVYTVRYPSAYITLYTMPYLTNQRLVF